MKKYFPIAISISLIVAASGCRMHDFRTVVIKAPDATTRECVAPIAANMLEAASMTEQPQTTSFDGRVTLVYGPTGNDDLAEALKGAPSPDAVVTTRAFPPKKAAARNKGKWQKKDMAIQMIEFDLKNGTITVVYDSMKIAVKNLEYAVADAGYDVETIPCDIPGNADAKAKRQAEARGPKAADGSADELDELLDGGE